jgi:ABC-type Fe3+ transport system permease subunit
MGAILFGSILLIASVVGVLTARRAVEKGTERINWVAPNSDHRTILRVGTTIRWIFVVVCFLVGIGMIVAGAVGALK